MRRSLQHIIVTGFLATGSLAAVACGGSGRAAMPTSLAAPAGISMAQAADPAAPVAPSAERFTEYGVNPMVDAAQDHLSTFAIDVDTASYSIARRYLMQQNTLPPVAAVRVEEFVNSFGYDYARSTDTKRPFEVYTAGAPSPFAKGHTLLRVALQGRQVTSQTRKPVHLVYLVDTSGSMTSPDKLGLVQESLRVLTASLHQGDTVAICTYAGSVTQVLAPTDIESKAGILKAIDQLTAGGSTAMSSGIELAYALASKTHVKGEISRVIVLSDGDANVGTIAHEDILKSIERYGDQGITLSTVGYGSGNYQDTMMEQLADHGNGNYSYIDTPGEARRVFGESVDGLLQVIARDVKVQVDFDPSVVKEYRLVGYENREVADKDFKNDKVDGGEVGAGHSVTALYDVVFQPNAKAAAPLTVHVRAKPALDGEQAIETAYAMDPKTITSRFDDAPASFRFATAVAGFAEILRKSPAAKSYGYADVQRIAEAALEGKTDRAGFVDLVQKASKLDSGSAVAVVAK